MVKVGIDKIWSNKDEIRRQHQLRLDVSFVGRLKFLFKNNKIIFCVDDYKLVEERMI